MFIQLFVCVSGCGDATTVSGKWIGWSGRVWCSYVIVRPNRNISCVGGDVRENFDLRVVTDEDWCEYLQIDENVQREIINHRSLRHPNIVRFKEVRNLHIFLIIPRVSRFVAGRTMMYLLD